MEARDQMAYNTQPEQVNDLVDQEAQKTNTSLPLNEDRTKSPSPPPKILNKDLVMETEPSVPKLPSIKKTVIRKA
jgi:hypothetical protein